MRQHQLSVTYPEAEAQQLRHTLHLLKRSHCLKISAFCRQAIAEKLKPLECVEAVK